jgi:hydroxypyruvate reductase
MARGALSVLGDAVDEGVVLVPEPMPSRRPAWLPPQVALLAGGHPLPTEAGVAAAEQIANLVAGARDDDRLLVLLGGGGSALLALPAEGLDLHALVTATDVLLRAGLPIAEVNLVRRHLERLKGGGLARLAGDAQVLGLVLSDVPGDDPAVVASGPLSPDGTRPRDAEILLRRRGLWSDMPRSVRRRLEADRRVTRPPEAPAPNGTGRRPAEPPRPGVLLRLVGGGAHAVDGAAGEARRRGYTVHVLTRSLQGEARAVGRGLARVGLAVRDGVGPVRPPACLLAAGETTVHVRGEGSGGRNQEVALSAACALDGEDQVLVASLGTDGRDGPTDAAGGWADGSTATRGRACGLDAAAALDDNDAYRFLDAAGALLRTGPTGTNVADLMMVLVGGA